MRVTCNACGWTFIGPVQTRERIVQDTLALIRRARYCIPCVDDGHADTHWHRQED